MIRRRVAAVVSLAVLLTVAAPVGAWGQGADARPFADRRVVIVAVPGLRWIDLEEHPVEHLRALLDESAIANLSTRVTGRLPTAGEGYLTLGSGTRAVAPTALGGAAYDATEPFGAGTAAEEHARQHGGAGGDVVSLAWPRLVAENDETEFRAEVGALGQALSDASITRGVVGNGDGVDANLVSDIAHREVALALADEQGAVSCGSVGSHLSLPDPRAPFGVRMDQDAVLAEVDRCASPGSVVLVEASDLRRAGEFASRATSEQAEMAWVDALTSTDRLVGHLLDRLDPERDAIVIVAPTTAPERGLGVVGVRAAELRDGFLTSGSTRRPGYALLTDVAPTIAALAGADIDSGSIEGRPMEVRTTSGTGPERRHDLVDGEAAALFRDGVVDGAVLLLVGAVSVLALLAAVAFAWRREWAFPWLERLALGVLAFPLVTYLAALFPFHEWNPAAFWSFLVAGSALVGVAAAMLRRSWLTPLVVVAGLLIAAVTVSVVLLDSRLQQSTVFGDSPIIAGRFTGINNVTFSFFALAGIILAWVIVHAVAAPNGRRWMVVLLSLILVIDVAPMWGADVGGALAGLPALALVAMGLGRWRVQWRTVALLLIATVVLVVLLGALDITRDSADRSHLGRLFERVGSDGVDGFTTVVERKLNANLRSLTGSPWRFVFGPVALAAGLVAWRARARAAAVVKALPPLVAALPGIGVAALLGYALNDSGIAVPAAMLSALVPALVYLGCRVDVAPAAPREPSP